MAYTPPNKRALEPKPQKPERDFFDKVTLVVAIVGVIVIAGSTVIGAVTAILMRSQLIVMEAQQRPWLRLEMDDTNSLAFRDGGIAQGIRANVKNVGAAVAINITIQARVIAVVPDSYAAEVFEEQRIICRHTADDLSIFPYIIGFHLFPGDQETTAIPIRETQKELLWSQARKPYELVLVGCLDYQFYLSPELHQTRFAFGLKKLGADNLTLSPVTIGDSLGPDRLRFERDWGNNYAN